MNKNSCDYYLVKHLSFQSTTGEKFLLQADYLINAIVKENFFFHLTEPLTVILALIFSPLMIQVHGYPVIKGICTRMPIWLLPLLLK